MRNITTILFDLDGTLLDTAPDFLVAINTLREQRDLPPLTRADFEHSVANGADAMLAAGLGITSTHKEYATAKSAFLSHYRDNINRYTLPFPGVIDLLEHIEHIGLRWGIVTNKPHEYSVALLVGLQLFSRASCVISGDMVTKRKPHPEPLLLACKLLACLPTDCIYVGDTKNDITAGKAAGMKTAAVLFSYVASHEDVSTWQADIMLQHPRDLQQLLGS